MRSPQAGPAVVSSAGDYYTKGGRRMDAQTAQERARECNAEAQRLQAQADQWGDLEDVYGFIAAGWTAQQWAAWRAGLDPMGWGARVDSAGPALAYAVAQAEDIWTAIAAGNEQRAALLAYETREHYRQQATQ